MDKKREWYTLPDAERRRIMADHIRDRAAYPEITINTAYSFGIDDQEFVVSFECRRPGDVPRPRPGAARHRVQLLHAARHPDLHLRRDVGRPGARRARRRRHFARRARRADGLDSVPFPARMSDIGTPDNPLRAAIIGSGPGRLLRRRVAARESTSVTVEVDMFDRLPTPFGLVRAGVAPDHPKIKNVIKRYEKTAASEGFRFFGNVEVGREISPAELAERYHAVIYAYGSSTDRKLGIPGEDLPGSHAATEFVAWYNAHPDFADHEFDLSCERVVVIGNGNVAADVARMLALTREELEETDTADHAIEAHGRERRPRDRRPRPPRARPGGLHQPRGPGAGRDGRRRRLHRPRRLRARRGQPRLPRVRRGRHDRAQERRHLHRVLPARARGQAPPHRPALPLLAGRDQGRRQGREHRDRPQRARRGRRRPHLAPATPASARSSSAASCSARSATRGSASRESRSTRTAARSATRAGGCSTTTGAQVEGQYVVGWIKRGPSGVIGTNKKDAQETIDLLFEDLAAGRVPEPAGGSRSPSIEELLAERSPDTVVSFAGWEAIDAAEKGKGEPLGRPRVKFCRIDEMLDASRSKQPA